MRERMSAREDERGKVGDDAPAGKLERLWALNFIIVGAIFVYFGSTIAAEEFVFDFNAVIALFLALGLMLHWTPIAYVRSFTGSAGAIGSIALQYPLLGGI